jgi:hypothetical protein
MNFFDYLNAREQRGMNLDYMIGRTQRQLSQLTLLIIAFVGVLLFLGPKLDATVEKLLFTILGGLLTAWAMQNTFWFGRPRSAGIPDPTAPGTTVESSTTIKQVTPAAPVALPAGTGDSAALSQRTDGDSK